MAWVYYKYLIKIIVLNKSCLPIHDHKKMICMVGNSHRHKHKNSLSNTIVPSSIESIIDIQWKIHIFYLRNLKDFFVVLYLNFRARLNLA